MNILYVSNNLRIGGKEGQIVQLINAISQNPNIQIGICLRENSIDNNIPFSDQIRLFKPKSRLTFYKLLIFQRKIINSFKPDIIHTWESGVTYPIALMKFLSFRFPVVIDGTIRYSRSFSKNSIHYWLLRFNRSIANCVVANSVAGLKSIDYAKKSKYHVINNGINLNLISKNKEKLDNKMEIKIGMVASFTSPKDYKTLLQVGLKILEKHHNIKFFFIGDGPERKEIFTLIPKELKKHFVFTGNIKEPLKYISTLDIGVLLSKKNHSEGLSNAIIEYMAASLPVVCTKTGGNIELVINEETGFLVEHENANQIFDTLIELIKSEDLRSKMGIAARKRVEQNFSIDKMVSKYINLYKSLINQ